jgi:NADH-quinone oxidoreductase subunit C
MPTNSTTIAAIQAKFAGTAVSEFRDRTKLTVPQAVLGDLLSELKNELGFDLLVDVTCVDYLNYRGATDRFGLTYLFANTETNDRLTVQVMLNEPHLNVPSAVRHWAGANWLEREVYDMFGITFDGHPDLRRILMPAEYTAYPLRKDYPLQGKGERHNFPVLARGDDT